MKLTRKETVKKHRDMWNWIADQLESGARESVDSLKEQYMENSGEENIEHDCFLCHYARKITDRSILSGMCDACPVLWGTEEKTNFAYCENGMKDEEGCNTGLWFMCKEKTLSGKYKIAAKIARKIANLPWKKEIKE